MNLTLADRAALYTKAFPNWPGMWADKEWLLGVWSIGNNYKNHSTYWGAYPHGYLKRINTLFPEAEKVLHLFSGSLPPGDYVRFDKRDDIDCDVSGEAEELSQHFPPGWFDLVYADPPYSGEDARNYGTTLVNRNKVVAECWNVVKPGGFLCWMDMILPMYSKLKWKRVGEILITRSTNHRVRAVFVFQRLP